MPAIEDVFQPRFALADGCEVFAFSRSNWGNAVSVMRRSMKRPTLSTFGTFDGRLYLDKAGAVQVGTETYLPVHRSNMETRTEGI